MQFIMMGKYMFIRSVISSKKISAIILSLMFMLVSVNCYAASGTIKVSDKLNVLSMDNRSMLISITNTNSREPAYVDSKVMEVISSSSDSEELKDVTNVLSDSLIISPKKFIIAPGSRVNVRLFYNTERSKLESDLYFKVRFQPQLAFNLEDNSDYKNNINTEVFISVGVSSLVAIKKTKPNNSINVKKTGKEFYVTNDGDSIVTLDDCNVCSESNLCEILGQIRLTPGRSRSLTQGSDTKSYECKLNDYSGTLETIKGNSY
ncbi:hypothetical protein MD535_24020 [Vibrio sp. ZSDZ65]|uniref:Pili assembly chaperone N-terminal domain-containing protein n=1 Tax=Vibrio qingdaonensis TaxID=2829491 RepID=A0A9X3CSQ4_9VIBR|nr:hypothetical protein [Vibrio qingdaonensis]MCW8349061.1 hypothetical protein [Vibrio qingdaonensis]